MPLLFFTMFLIISPGYEPMYVNECPLSVVGSFYAANEMKTNGISKSYDKSWHIVVFPQPGTPNKRRLVP